jgi:5-(carboxyamino)imidazole ribonucleotide synthase
VTNSNPYLCRMQNTDSLKIGILGGGQLGRMLLQAAANYVVETYILEDDAECPAAHLCHHFSKGNIRDFDDVYAFGKNLDAITIEIENVNIEALEKLESEGVKVFPNTTVLKTIKNKISQKDFYQKNNIPTAEYVITNNLMEVENHIPFLPAVHKIAEGGYDGRGVQILKTEADISKGFDKPAVLEKMIDLEKEIAVTVAVSQNGDMAVYPPVEMIVDHELNMLDFQLCPADLNDAAMQQVKEIALSVASNFNSAGLFAIEMMMDKQGEIYVNETAPRVHNSGHHTIEAHNSSQFDMLWRIMLNYPLGNTDAINPSVMLNLVGAENHNGPVHYEGLKDVLATGHSFVHLYGKKITKPGRKMGHITITGLKKEELLLQAGVVKKTLLSKTK